MEANSAVFRYGHSMLPQKIVTLKAGSEQEIKLG